VALANMAAGKPGGWMGDGVGEQRLSGDISWRRRVAGAEAAPSSREGADAGVTGAVCCNLDITREKSYRSYRYLNNVSLRLYTTINWITIFKCRI
jgi:hypothetical protein